MIVILMKFVLAIIACLFLHNAISSATTTRIFMRKSAIPIFSSFLLASNLMCSPFVPSSFAAEPSSAIVYKSGKSPIGKVAEKSESKKDISFLRCMSNCKAKCQLPGEGPAKGDCVLDCQDQCCDSYEQCSFRVKTTGNTI